MVEAKYFRDYNHNYIIFKCKSIEDAMDSYQTKMLISNKIDRILKCSARSINGESYLYYDISSKVTLENLYQGKKMSYEQVKDMFYQMDIIYRNLGQYFMKEGGLLMQPGYIYYDFTSQKYFGLYYPAADELIDNSYEPLMDFLLNHMDAENQKLAEIVYQIYEMSGESYFSIADVMVLFESMEENASEPYHVASDVLPETEALAETETMPDAHNHVEPLWLDNEDDEEEIYPYPAASKGLAERNKKRGYYAVFAVLSFCGIGAVCWIFYQFKLTQQELMILLCCGAVMGLCLIFSSIQFFLCGRKGKRIDEADKELQRDIEDEFRDERAVALQGVLDKNMNAAVKVYSFEENRLGRGSFGYGAIGQASEGTHERYGETVFVDIKRQNREYKLYALDKKNKKHIELTQFPFTIGKMAGCVDCVLADDSISRLHARIEKQDEKILLTDMNSKNGTYKNGLRMEPSETVEIEPGDEIRFGKLNYCYR